MRGINRLGPTALGADLAIIPTNLHYRGNRDWLAMQRLHRQALLRPWIDLRASTLMLLASTLVAPIARDVGAADPSAAMVEALRQRGWFDTAAEYVDWIEQSPLASAESRARLPYERALARAAQAKQSQNLRVRARLLGEATDDFLQFAETSGDSPLSLDALRQAANLSAEQAVSIRAEAQALPSAATRQREALLAKARARFAQAKQAALELGAMCRRNLAEMPKPAMLHADPEARETLELLRSRKAEAGFLLPLVDFELAETYPNGSSDRIDVLRTAQRQFEAMHEQYADALVGVTSQFYVGRCQQLLGDLNGAVETFEKIVGKPVANEQFRRWMTRAHRHRAECLMELGEVNEAIRDSEQWLEASEPRERKQPEWLAATFRLAEAYLAKAEQDAQSEADDRRLVSQARLLLRDVATERGEFQQQAKIALASFRQNSGETKQDYDNFKDAYDAGKSALEVANSSKLAARLARDNNPDAVEELEQGAANSRAEALELLELAVQLADEDTLEVDLQAARYYLAFLYLEAGRVQEAAEASELIATEFAGSEFARGAAKIAFSAYERLYRDAIANGQGQREREQLRRIAELIAERWPDSEEASAATGMLISLALQENDVESAQAMLDRLPASRKAAGQLSLGAALWTNYLNSVAEEGPGDATAKQRAAELLAAGYKGAGKSGEASAAVVTGVLYYAQLLLGEDETEQAIDILQDAAVGPLTLVQQGRFADRPELAVETYKTALRAYLAASPPRREQAQAMMAALEDAVAAGDDGQRKLTNIYISLGLQLESQINQLNEAGRIDQARSLAATFEDVLNQVAGRPGANTWKVNNWLAHMYLEMGKALGGAEADALIDRAEEQLRSILAQAERDPSFAPNDAALLGVRKQLADCRVARGDYGEALEQYVRILREKPALLELQIASADALQQWGVAIKSVKALDQAIGGAVAQQDGSNLVWGWIRLAKVVDAARRRAASGAAESAQQVERYEQLFYRARFNAALARFQAAQIATGAERTKHLRTVKQSLGSMKTLYPDLGGPPWKARFDRLIEQVDQQLQLMDK